MRELAERLVAWGKADGADEIEVSVVEGREFNVDVRRGRIENLVEAGSRVLGFRVIKDKRTAVASSSDLEPGTLRRLVKNAVRRAELAEPDEFAGLAPLTPLTVDAAALRLYDPAVPALDPKTMIGLALETERIALADRRITNSYGASFSSDDAAVFLANSNGFSGGYSGTYCGLGVGLQAGGTNDRVEDSWYSSKRFFRELASPEKVAKKAVERTVRQLRPRKVRTKTVPVVFEPTMTSWVMGFLFSCIAGTSVYQKASFLAEKLGKRIGNPLVHVIDDGLIPGELGSRPFDSDGVSCRRTVVVDKGVLRNFLCNVYAARKLGLRTTGNADGGGVSPHNFSLAPGTSTPEEIVRSVKEGLLLTRTLGHGLNSVTGDISRGAFGLWIENGEIAYPVSEVTISGNLGALLEGIEMVGNDLEFLSPIAGPTIKVAGMTVAGE
jgi:PmbA protein